MLRQSLAAPVRALRSGVRIAARQPISRTQFIQFPSRTSQAIATSYPRWYSAEAGSAAKAEGAKANGEAETAEGSGKTEAQDAEAALKKQLEAKEAEVLDLKVR
jgi:molecular chaperone GrpE